MRPIDVNEQNKSIVWGRLFGKVMKIEKPKFSVGDHVRVLHFDVKSRGKKFQDYFRKKYPKKISQKTGKPVNIHIVSEKDKSPFSNEIFTIHEVLLGDPIVYKLYSDEAHLEILGKFYENELSLVL